MTNEVPLGATPSRMGRRQAMVFGGVAAAAAMAGVAWKLVHERERPGISDSLSALWPLSFERPEGGPALAMAALRGRPLLLNFWATWCPPCIEEFPLIDAFYKENNGKGWQVLGLAVDQPSSVRKFLARAPVSFPVGLAGMEGTELGRSLGNLAGGLPFTVVIGADGLVRHRRMGRISPEDLTQWRSLA